MSSPIVLRTKSIHFDLKGAECETSALRPMLLDKLRRLEGTNIDKCHVIRITRIINVSDRKWNPRAMYGEMSVSVVFEYEAEVLALGILHNATIVHIDEIDGDIIGTCSIGNHTTATIIIDQAGVVVKGMVVPIRALQIEYQQTLMNTITVQGELLKPTQLTARSFLIALPTDEEVELAVTKLAAFDATVARVSSLGRAQFFRAWLYPYKQTPRTPPSNLAGYVNKKPAKKSMCVRLDDTCDPSGLQFIIAARSRIIDQLTFSQFVDALIADGTAIWQDIEQLCITYAADETFNRHRSVWAYYEAGKLNSRAAPEAESKKGGTDTASEIGDTESVTGD